MAEAIVMPNLGMDMTEGTLLNWTKNVGDTIKPGDVIAEVETDKTAIEVAAEVGGTILQLIGSPGEMLRACRIRSVRTSPSKLSAASSAWSVEDRALPTRVSANPARGVGPARASPRCR